MGMNNQALFLFIYLFTYLFIYLLIYLFKKKKKYSKVLFANI